jgi:hypothetical protein
MQEAGATECCSSGVESRRLPPSAIAAQTCLPLSSPLMRLDEDRAREKNCRKCQKKTAETGRRNPRRDLPDKSPAPRAQSERDIRTNGFLQRRELEVDHFLRHLIKTCSRPSAAANQQSRGRGCKCTEVQAHDELAYEEAEKCERRSAYRHRSSLYGDTVGAVFAECESECR